MDSKNSYGTSWADQWDYNPDPIYDDKKNDNKFSDKAGDRFGKTKAAATTGMKKVKGGAYAGFQWVKVKYQKTTQKH